MYLEELLGEATLVDEVNPTLGDVVILPRDVQTWCDRNLVVSRQVCDTVYVKYRASEPDSEIILNKLLSDPIKDFYRALSELPMIRDAFVKLRGATTLVESIADQPTADLGEEAQNPVPSIWEVPNAGCEEQDGQGNYVPAAELVTIADPKDETADETKVVGEINEAKEVEDVPPHFTVNPATIDSVAFDPFGDLPPVEDITPPGINDTDNFVCEPEPDIEAFAPDNVSVPEEISETMFSEKAEELEECAQSDEDIIYKRNQEYGFYRNIVILKGSIPNPDEVASWAHGCTKIYGQMHSDFSVMLETISVEDILSSNKITPDEFLRTLETRVMCDDVLKPFYVMTHTRPCIFLDLLRTCYLESLQFCRDNREEDAVTLTTSFMNLIYEV